MVHGGVYSAMAESAISYAATISQEGMWAGVNNNTDFIASATEGVLLLKAQPLNQVKDHNYGKQKYLITIIYVRDLLYDLLT